MELMQGAHLGPYEILERLPACSPLAGVYRAHQASLDRDVTLTVLTPALLAREGVAARIRASARLAALLHHPHIVPLYDLHCEGELCYLVAEHVPGPTLAERLEAARAGGERLPLAEVLRVAQAMGAALSYAHSRGAVHGQVQPAHIVFTSGGEPALAGFGLAGLAEGMGFTEWLNSPISPAYLSPEQCRGQAATPASDIYALGATLYEMATGERPFSAVSPLDVAIKQASEPPRPPRELAPELPAAVERTILRALAKDPAGRYASAAEMIDSLSAAPAAGAGAVGAALAAATALVEGPPDVEMPETGLSKTIDTLVASVRGEGAEKKGGGRGWWAQVLALLGAGLALLQYLVQVFDLINKPLAPIVRAMPYVIILFFIVAAAASALVLLRPGPRLQKRIAAAALGLIAVASLSWGGWTFYNATRPPKAVVVLVAEFGKHPDARGVDWGRRIYLQVRDQLSKLGLDGQVEVRRVFETFDDPAAARAAGQAQKATLVLWGLYDDLGVEPHFEVLRSARPYAGLLATAPVNLVDFDLYARTGPQEMAYITGVVLGLARYAESDYDGAISLFSSAIAAAPAETAVQGQESAYLFRAVARLEAHAPVENAIADLKEATRRNPEMYQAHWCLAAAYTMYCSPALALDEALAEAQTVVRLRPADSGAQVLLGQVYAERAEWAESEAAHREALRLNASNGDAYAGLARALDEQGRTAEAKAAREQALAVRQKALAAKPADPAAAQDSVGTANLQAERYEAAIAAYKEAVRLAPTNASYHSHLGNAYYWQSKSPGSEKLLDEAIGEYQQAIGLDPYDAATRTNLANVYNIAGRAGDALHEYEEAVRVAPCDASSLFLLANQYSTMGRDADAEAAFARLAELKPSMSIAWHYLGSAAFARGDYAAAEAAYRAALHSEPGDANLHYALASALYGLERYAEAEAEYRRCTELLPQDAASFAGLGDALAKLGRSAEAIAAYDRALQLDAEQPLVWVSLGLLYEAGRDWAQAEQAYAQAARLAPDNALTRSAHARALWQLNRIAEAVAEYEAAARLAPNDPTYPESLALGYASLNQLDQARAAAEATLKLNPQSAIAHLILGGIAEDRGDTATARAEYQLALQYAGENAGLKQLAEQGLARVGE
ncbi:MAG TPA: tetratricopeptide repeat protein [Anaerolineae bacterium]|nr:tetratricopeptide repeat protein [Anaerolineae bacterium]HPL29263.1 tetratricopeptide repeat protein [Anaerolineae bacterium]